MCFKVQWKLQSRYHRKWKLRRQALNISPELKKSKMSNDEAKRNGGDIQKIQYTNKNSGRRPEQIQEPLANNR